MVLIVICLTMLNHFFLFFFVEPYLFFTFFLILSSLIDAAIFFFNALSHSVIPFSNSDCDDAFKFVTLFQRLFFFNCFFTFS